MRLFINFILLKPHKALQLQKAYSQGKSRFWLFLVLMALASKAFAHRENTYYLQGHAGKQEIAVKLEEYGVQSFMTYYWLDTKQRGIMEGKILADGTFVIHHNEWDSVQKKSIPTDLLVMKEIENHHWQGKWVNKAGDSLKVELQPIDIDHIPHPYLKGIKRYGNMRIDAFTALLTKDVNFISTQTTKPQKQPGIEWFIHPQTGIKHFRVVADKGNKVQVDSINLFLATEQTRLVASKLNCGINQKNSFYESTVDVHFVDQHVVSYSLSVRSSCLGGMAQTVTTHHTLRLKDVKKLELEDLYWFGPQPKPEMRKGGQEWYKYRYQVFGQKIVGLMQTSYPKHFKNANDDCAFKQVKFWQFPDWYLTKKGLFLEGKSMFKKGDCDNPLYSAILPWKAIAPYYVGP